ncbi:Alpha/Beta hydrolase protein [Phyllosticta capitalensis]|uniref:Alpha/Beta hydrolase protein n=1 Tax=Phyllosticta capitalensis TaxID=121624 RepID=UPI00312F502E
MIDHVLGRPSIKFRKIQVLAVVSFWSAYLYRGNRHGPPLLQRLSSLLSNRLTTWQTVIITLLWLYVARNFGKLVGLECPEPLANLYSRSYFRATWVTTALDAGFWSAMPIRRKWVRDLCSVVFTFYYLICAEQADEKVRKVRATLTVDHLRVSWNKGTTPYLNFLTNLMRPRIMRYPPRAIRIPRPAGSSYKDPVQGWLYFDGPISALKNYNKVVLDIPGGGFVAMTPRHHDDKLMGWAAKTGLPVLSLNYKKAPEYPYPYALNECYDVYHTIIASRGRCLGLSGESVPKILVAGDSAGGNLAVGMVLMILQSGTTEHRRWHGEPSLPPPEALFLVYPALDMNIGNWMTDEQMALIRDRKTRKTNDGILRRKSDDYRKLTPNTPHHSDDEDDEDQETPPADKSKDKDNASSKTLTQAPVRSPSTAINLSAAHTGVDSRALEERLAESPSLSQRLAEAPLTKPKTFKTRLAMSSMISYFGDRILTPEMMRAMIILYIGPHNRPDFSTDYLLSPLLAPESLLVNMPKTYFLTGERDPLVDDTVIFAGRIRQAKAAAWRERKELGLLSASEARAFVDEDHVEVILVPGISHGFLQFVSVFPDGWRYIFRCARWMRETADQIDRDAARCSRSSQPKTNGVGVVLKRSSGPRHHFRRSTFESSGDDERPLEMTFPGKTQSTAASRHLATTNGNASAAARNRRFQADADDVSPGCARRPEPADDYFAGATAAGGSSIKVGGVNGSSHDVDEEEDAANGDEANDDPANTHISNGTNGGKGSRGRGRGRTAGSGHCPRRKSLVSLASEDDLLGRRMRGLTGSLMRPAGQMYEPSSP